MEFVEEDEEIDIKYEYNLYDTDEIELDHDLGSSSHCPDWKLNPNVECRVMLEKMKSLNSDKEVQGNSDENYEAETETNARQNESVDKSCVIYRKLKLLVDSLKNCERRENCGLCEKYIQQLQQHLLFSHGNDRVDSREQNINETETCLSASEPVSLDRNDVPSDKKTMDVNIPHSGVAEYSEEESGPSLTIAPENGRESTSRDKDPCKIKGKCIPKGGKSKPYKCDTCQLTFLTFYELTQHENTHVEEKRKTNNVREKTPLTPSNSTEEGLPTGRQKKRFTCEICRKDFSSSNYLILHRRIHTGERPYKCDVCGKCFTQKRTLNLHLLSHTGKKRNWCEVCGKCFTFNSDLRRHKSIHTGEKPYKCDVCGKCFGQKGNLATHKLTHTGERPHRCNLCGKCFAWHSLLKLHKLSHTGEKPHKCDVCGKCFAKKGHLTEHIRTHTGAAQV